MKKWLKIILAVLGLAGLFMAIYVIRSWSSMDILLGTEKLEGAIETIPAAAGELPPLAKGPAGDSGATFGSVYHRRFYLWLFRPEAKQL